MRNRASKVVAFGSGIVLSLLLSLPVLASRYNNPGYEWGRTQCGRAPGTGGVRSAAKCRACCGAGAGAHYPAGDELDCRHFCNRAYWP